MLTPEEIKSARFATVAPGAYNAEEVDDFLKEVSADYNLVFSEKSELLKKISILAGKVEKYRQDEDAIKLALLDARKTAESVTKEANQNAETVVSSANAQAKSVLDKANSECVMQIDIAKNQAKEIVENARTAVASLTERAQLETQKTINAATAKAEEIIGSATRKADDIVGNSKKEYDFYTAELVKLKAEVENFKSQIKELCDGQLDLIETFPNFNDNLAAEPDFAENEDAFALFNGVEISSDDFETEIVAEEPVNQIDNVEVQDENEEPSADFSEEIEEFQETEIEETQDAIVEDTEEDITDEAEEFADFSEGDDEQSVEEQVEESADESDEFSFVGDMFSDDNADKEPADVEEELTSKDTSSTFDIDDDYEDLEDLFSLFDEGEDSPAVDFAANIDDIIPDNFSNLISDNTPAEKDDDTDITSLFESLFD